METCNFLCESDASGAVDASVHVSYNKGTDVLVLNGSLELIISTCCVAVVHGVVLQIAFTTLIADGTVERMVDKEELHDTTSSESGDF